MHYQKRLNPYLRNRASGSDIVPSIKRYIAIGASIIGTAIVIAFLPLWQLNAITLEGSVIEGAPLPTVLADYFKEHTGLVVNERNLLFLDSSQLRTKLQSAYSTDKVLIKKHFPATLAITMSDPGATAIFVTRGKSYALDPYGKIIGPTSQAGTNTRIIYDTGATLPVVGAQVVRPEFIQFLETLEREKGFQGNQIKYALAPSSNDGSSVTLALEKGFRIMIDPTADITEQLGRMNKIVNQLVTPAKISTLDYIDLRFKERVFYKTK